MNVRFETTGCRLNQIESESAAEIFTNLSFSVSLKPLSAASPVESGVALCVVNTCAVTGKAEQKDRRLIRLALEKYPAAAVIVTGCYAQLSAGKIAAMDGRIAVLPGQLKSRLSGAAALLKEYEGRGDFSAARFAEDLRRGLFAAAPETPGVSEGAFRMAASSFLAHSRSSVKIQDGCDRACSYCAIRAARGRSVSLDAAAAAERLRLLERLGQAEAVITGVNIGRYRGDYHGRTLDLPQLLDLLLESTDRIALRLSSLYPDAVDGALCSVIRNPRVRPHFHLSVQSGSDSVLAAMGRSYRAEDVREACRLLRRTRENPFIACDIITGFPGETDADFEETARLCRDCAFAWVHVFPFSARPGTAAAKMRAQVPQSVSRERARRLSAQAAESKIAYINSWKGKTLPAVMESPRCGPAGNGRSAVLRAVTENFLHCEIAGAVSAPPAGGSVSVVITAPLESRVRKGGETECAAVLARAL